MNIVNRGYLLIMYRQGFLSWANQFNEVEYKEGELEPSVYLIEEEFIEEDKVIEGLFKKIMQVEFVSVTEDEEQWPEISREKFDELFTCITGSIVIDTVKNAVQREEI